MATALLNIYADSDSKQLFKNASSLERVVLSFVQGESPPVSFTLLTQNVGSFTAPWTKISPAQYALKLGLFRASDGTQLGFQDTFTDDPASGSKSAELTFNSAVIDPIMNALSAGASLDCIFEAEVKNAAGSPRKIQQAVSLNKQFITPSAATVAAPEVAATQAFSKALFFPKDGSNPQNQCNQFIILSQPGNIPILCYFTDAGVLKSIPQG